MIGGKILGTVLALMIADIKRISQVFWRFKSADMLEKSEMLLLPIDNEGLQGQFGNNPL